MAKISFSEQEVLEELFDMRDGYFLKFSDRQFSEFFRRTLELDISDEKYVSKGTSKANRFRVFVETASNPQLSQVIEELLLHIQVNFPEKAKNLIEHAKKIASRLVAEQVVEKGPIIPEAPNQKISLFISHKSAHEESAKELANAVVEKFPFIETFVAGDNITPNSKWEDEILKALEKMDCLLLYLTSDFHGSYWTNQEVGYALGRKDAKIISYSVDGTSPVGFSGKWQAVRKGQSQLFQTIEREFSGHCAFRKNALDNFARAKKGSFQGSKEALIDLVDMEFQDDEIDVIVENVRDKATENNQHRILLLSLIHI